MKNKKAFCEASTLLAIIGGLCAICTVFWKIEFIIPTVLIGYTVIVQSINTNRKKTDV